MSLSENGETIPSHSAHFLEHVCPPFAVVGSGVMDPVPMYPPLFYTERKDRHGHRIERRMRTCYRPHAYTIARAGSPIPLASVRSLGSGVPRARAVATLEHGQVERVIQRQRDVEALMDSPLAGTGDDERELGKDASVRLPSSPQDRQPVG